MEFDRQAYAQWYRDTHKEETKIYRKKYYNENRDSILAKAEAYSKTHTDESKLYREQHKDELRDKRQYMRTCECGSEFRHRYLKSHLLTKRHMRYLNPVDEPPKPKRIRKPIEKPVCKKKTMVIQAKSQIQNCLNRYKAFKTEQENADEH